MIRKLRPTVVLALGACWLIGSEGPRRERENDTKTIRPNLSDEIIGSWQGLLFGCCSNEIRGEFNFRRDGAVEVIETRSNGGGEAEKRRFTRRYRITGSQLLIEGL